MAKILFGQNYAVWTAMSAPTNTKVSLDNDNGIFYFIFKYPLYVKCYTYCVSKCKFCGNEIKYEQARLEHLGSVMHVSCFNENEKWISEHKCVNCNGDLLKDDFAACDKCDGEYTDYPGT